MKSTKTLRGASKMGTKSDSTMKVSAAIGATTINGVVLDEGTISVTFVGMHCERPFGRKSSFTKVAMPALLGGLHISRKADSVLLHLKKK